MKEGAKITMLIGYMRVSTTEQSLGLQSDALEKAGCRKIYEDVCSDRSVARPCLSQVLNNARDALSSDLRGGASETGDRAESADR